MGDKQEDQRQPAEHQAGVWRRLLQRGHSGEGVDSVLDLLRRRRDIESRESVPPEPAADSPLQSDSSRWKNER